MRSFIILSLFLMGCASIQPLSGGDKDELPPKVVHTSIDSAAINVTASIFLFDFNEYIQQKQAVDKLLISPNQSKPPTITVKKKSLTIELNDDLIPNTTYTFQFNGAITDINENNPLTNYNFIFSTGNYIDSATYSGNVINYLTKDPCKACNVHLYDSFADTTVLRAKPAYLTRTDEAGRFTFNNLPNRLFTALALKDENKNLFFESNELISLPLPRHTDSTNQDSLYVFMNENTATYKLNHLKQTLPGVYQFTSNKPLTTDTVILSFNSQPISYRLSRTKDTVTAIYAQTKDTLPISIVVNSDTFNFKNIQLLSNYKYTLKPALTTSSNRLILKSKTPIVTIDTSRITLLVDSINTPITISLIDTFSFFINKAMTYTKAIVLLENGAITDIYKKTNNTDTLTHRFIESDPTNLNLTIHADSGVSCILHVLKGSKIIKYSQFIGSKKLTFHDLQQGDYKVIIYSDSNNNGIWDTGNIFTLKRPETITLTTTFELRQNWDKELTINIK